MTITFAANEIQKAIAKIKPNKSPGCDEIRVELTKHALDRIDEQIVKIYNNMAETGDIPKKITYGILKPLQKPSKAKGRPSNLRPIILLPPYARLLQHVSPTESKIDRRQKYHHRKQPKDQTYQQLNMY